MPSRRQLEPERSIKLTCEMRQTCNFSLEMLLDVCVGFSAGWHGRGGCVTDSPAYAISIRGYA